MELNRHFVKTYGTKKKLNKPALDEDLQKLLDFISDEGTDDEERQLANLWLTKFRSFKGKAINDNPKQAGSHL